MSDPPDHSSAAPVAVSPMGEVAHGARYALGGVLVVIGAALCWYLRDLLLAVLIALLLATGLEPLVAFVQRGRRRGPAVIIVLFVLILAVLALITLTLVPVTQQFSALLTDLPREVGQLSESDSAVGEAMRRLNVSSVTSKIAANLPSIIGTGLGVLFGVLNGLVVALTVTVLTAYFMMALPKMRGAVSAALGNDGRQRVLGEALARVGGYLTGQLMLALMAGSCTFAMLFVVGAPYPLALAFVVAFLNLIPQVGATLGTAVVVLVTLTDSMSKAVIMLCFFVVYQMVENWVVAPRVFAKKINLSPAAAFVATLAGVALAGVVGAVFALPITAAGKVVLTYTFRGRRGFRPEPA